MVKKSAKKKSPTMADRIDTIERLVRSGFRRVDHRFDGVDNRLDGVEQRLDGVEQRLDGVEQRLDGIDQRLDRVEQKIDILDLGQRDFKSEVNQRFSIVDERFNTLANHIDGFMKLHETLDIEFKVIKEQVSRLEERLKRLEAERPA